MSSQKGNINRSRSQKHHNTKAFKNDLYDKSKNTKMLNNLEITDVCNRCKAILEWKIKYKKYKILKQAGVCTKCHCKTVTKSYRTVCEPCASSFKICPKCNTPKSEWSTVDKLSTDNLFSNSDEEKGVKSEVISNKHKSELNSDVGLTPDNHQSSSDEDALNKD